jgi:3D (Asp-Asp-Asp) domain-containing protein
VLQVNKVTKEKEEVKKQLISRGEQNNKRVLNMLATAYVSFCDTGCIGETSIGIDVSKFITVNNMRIIAVDPSVIPLYSIVKVETNKENFVALAADKGGAIKGNRIDVLVAVHDTSKAFDFGTQNVKVTVLREGKG